MNGKIILAAMLGAVLSMAATLAVANHVIAETQKVSDAWRVQSDTWQKLAIDGTAEATDCVSKFTIGTVLLEPYTTSAMIPLPNTPFSLGLDLDHATSGVSVPVWMIPAKVKPITNQPGARYRWIDLKTGAVLGEYDVTPEGSAHQ